jgi:hypothetical protein
LKVFPDLPIDDIIDYIVKNNGHVEGLFEKFKTIDGINEDELKNIENVL